VRTIRLGAWLTALSGLFVAAMTVLAYTAGQAGAGREVFAIVCAGCHGANLQGVVGPALIGPAFQATWPNAAALFSFVSQNMPLGNPGSLSREQYWSIVAYLLQQNGINRDEKPLSEQTASQIKLQQGVSG